MRNAWCTESRVRLAAILAAGLLSTLLILSASAPCLARTFTVDANGTGDFTAIQSGIDACTHGDTVLVLPGTYVGPDNRNLDFGGVNLALIGRDGLETTVIDCEQQGRGIGLDNGEDSTAVIQGFTIVNGSMTGGEGGGILITGASPAIRNCRIADCSSSQGGGVSLIGSRTTMTGVLIEGCYGGNGGGLAMRGDPPRITGCTIRGNNAGGGGGVYSAYCSPALTECTIAGNRATNWGGGIQWTYSGGSITGCTIYGNFAGAGGGMWLSGNSPVLVASCGFMDNVAETGGGGGVSIATDHAATFRECRISGNGAAMDGGGVLSQSEDNLIEICVVAGNRSGGDGGGVAMTGGALTITGSTIARNVAGGVGSGLSLSQVSSLAMERTLVWAGCGADEIHVSGASTLQMACCAFATEHLQGPGQVIFDDPAAGDPLICDLPSCASVPSSEGEYTLASGSPCLPEFSRCGLLIGAQDVGCSVTPVEAVTWGRVKGLFR